MLRRWHQLLALVLAFVLHAASGVVRAQHPFGVNFGGLFVLEDWFFGNTTTSTHVSTPCGQSVAQASKFSLDITPDFSWSSETDLIHKLQAKYNAQFIVDAFRAHRKGYYGSMTENLAQIKKLGIKVIRLPVTWAMSYAWEYTLLDASNKTVNMPVNSTQAVADLYYSHLSWMTINMNDVGALMDMCAENGLKILIDIHAYPGGSGGGTYNGVFPLAPRFWTKNANSNFNSIFANLCKWVGSLTPQQKRAFYGITPMNEPAHLLGIHPAHCNKTSKWGENGQPLQYTTVLSVLQTAVTTFKEHGFDDQGHFLFMNIIGTMFPQSSTVPSIISAWWKRCTTSAERQKWATLDIHHYIAWPGESWCAADNGTCALAQNMKTNTPATWFSHARADFNMSSTDLFATTEFSASVNENTKISCSHDNPAVTAWRKTYVRNAFLTLQIAQSKAQNIKAFFWTWSIPLNINFQEEWSYVNITRNFPGANITQHQKSTLCIGTTGAPTSAALPLDPPSSHWWVGVLIIIVGAVGIFGFVLKRNSQERTSVHGVNDSLLPDDKDALLYSINE